MRGSLKGYLAICVANRCRNLNRAGYHRGCVGLAAAEAVAGSGPGPAESAMSRELSLQVGEAMAELPEEQREAIALRLGGGLKFRQIAESQGVSIHTAQSRYRNGMAKLAAKLDGQVES